MREMIVAALRQYYHGEIAKTKANVEIFLENNAGVGDHPDVIETIDKLITAINRKNTIIKNINGTGHR